MKPMVRLGIAGIGIIATDYISLFAAGKIASAELTAICSRNQVKMQSIVQQYNLSVAMFQDYDDMLKSGLIDAVVICTPHGLHPSMTKSAIRAGIHVLVEKPVGINVDKVTECIELLKEKPELVCGVLYNRRASKAYRFIKEQVSSGAIGKLVRCTWLITNLYRTNAYYSINAWRGSWKTEGGGILMTQASHQLDLMQWICGMPTEVLARCSTVNRPIQVENEAELFLTYPNGAHGHFIASAHECPGTNLLEICGTRGRITIRDDSEVEILRLDEDERFFAKNCPSPFDKVPYSLVKYTFDDSENKTQQAATIQNFSSAILGKEAVQCPLAEGLNSLQIIHAAYVSSFLQSSVILPVTELQFMNMVSSYS